jgi:hypothetical protein
MYANVHHQIDTTTNTVHYTQHVCDMCTVCVHISIWTPVIVVV